jgi:TRAP-type mannitol/chloroaromatic compound transport system permease small subunit
MNIFKQLVERLGSLAGVLVVALMFVQVTVVSLRYVFALGWTWALDLLVYLFFAAVILPGLAVLLGNNSVRVDVFYAGWTTARRRLMDRLALLVLFVPVMAYSAWASLGPMLGSWRVLEASPTFGGLPGYFLLKTGLTVFFALLALAGLLMALRDDPYNERSKT